MNDYESFDSFVCFTNYESSILFRMFILLIMSLLVRLFVLLIIGVYLSYGSEIKELSYNNLKQENQKQYRDLREINNEYDYIRESLAALIEKEEQLELLLGRAIVKKKN